MKNKYKIVEVHWDDSSSSRGWVNPDCKDEKPSKIQSIGFLVKDAKNSISISHSKDVRWDGIYAPISIPRSCITHYAEIEIES